MEAEEKLVERLREGTTIRLSETAATYTPPPKLQIEAADAISRLVGERDEARALSKEIYDKHGATIDRANYLTNALTAAEARVAQLETDLERMNWLVSQDVEVRTPLVYGSRANFVAQAVSDEEDAEYRTTLRDQIDAARTALSQSPDRESGT